VFAIHPPKKDLHFVLQWLLTLGIFYPTRLGLWRWPRRPPGYGPLARWSDARAGRRDGRASVVAASDGATNPSRCTVSTARVRALISRTEQRQEQERSRFDLLQINLERQRARYAGPLEGQRVRAAIAERELELFDGKPDLSRYGHLTDSRYPADFVERRRLREFERRRAETLERYVLVKERLVKLEQRLDTMDYALRALEDVAQLRVRQAHALGQLRIFTYWAELIVAHPEGAVVNAQLLPALPALPVWNGEGQHELPA